MKTVILAAGKGSRLGDPSRPKPLTMLQNGQSILGLQLHHLSKVVSINDILVVVGYHFEQIVRRYPDLLYVYNPRFEQENTSKSLLRALYKIDEDVLWLNGDVVFHPAVLNAVLERPSSAMVVNAERTGEEEVKYRCDPPGTIVEVSKSLKNAEGEALGINVFMRKDLPALMEGLEACTAHDYFEKGIEYAIQKGARVKAVAVNSTHCVEIDFPEDLVRADQMIKSWL